MADTKEPAKAAVKLIAKTSARADAKEPAEVGSKPRSPMKSATLAKIKDLDNELCNAIPHKQPDPDILIGYGAIITHDHLRAKFGLTSCTADGLEHYITNEVVGDAYYAKDIEIFPLHPTTAGFVIFGKSNYAYFSPGLDPHLELDSTECGDQDDAPGGIIDDLGLEIKHLIVSCTYTSPGLQSELARIHSHEAPAE